MYYKVNSNDHQE